MTLNLEGVHICHIQKHWLQRNSGSGKKWDENIGQMFELKGICMVKVCLLDDFGPFYKEDPYALSAHLSGDVMWCRYAIAFNEILPINCDKFLIYDKVRFTGCVIIGCKKTW